MEVKKFLIPIEIIPRHVHLSEKHWCELFGEKSEPQVLQQLSQRDQVVLKETVKIVGSKKNNLEDVCIVGGWRKQTQVEISETEAVVLGLNPPIRLSGRLSKTPGAKLIGPAGSVVLKQGIIIPVSHLHLNIKEAERFGLRQGELLSLGIVGRNGLILKNILARVHPSFRLSLHITQETAARAWLTANNKAVFFKTI
jgi:putative phosphotransacetylase